MAIYHCTIGNVSRASGGSSCATLAYISGEKVHDERRGVTYSYSRRERVAATGTLLPEGAPQKYSNPATLFNAIEEHETATNARVAKKIEVALPRELTLEQQKELIESFIRDNITAAGYAATYAIHDDGEGNPHCHILVSNRPLDTKGNWVTKSRKTYALDKNRERIPVIDSKTGKQKIGARGRKIWKRVDVEQNVLDKRDFLKSLRASWADHANAALRDAGVQERIDHRSYKDQELPLEPTKHLGFKHGKLYDKKQEINRKISEIDSLYKEWFDTERERESATEAARQDLTKTTVDIVALTMYHHMASAPMDEQTRDAAARQTSAEMGAALKAIGIPERKHLGFCLRCGYEIQEQLKGKPPQRISAGAPSPSPVSFDLAKVVGVRMQAADSAGTGLRARLDALSRALDAIKSASSGSDGIVSLGAAMAASEEEAKIAGAIAVLKDALSSAEAKAEAVAVLGR